MEIEPLDVGEIEACLQLLAEREDELCAMEAELLTPVTESELYRDAVGAMERCAPPSATPTPAALLPPFP
jgi:hypothetical protein